MAQSIICRKGICLEEDTPRFRHRTLYDQSDVLHKIEEDFLEEA
jgi:hypothetical protein